MAFKDWATLLFGFAAFCISAYNFTTARISEHKQRLSDIDQRRKTALIILRDDEISYMNSRRLLSNLSKDLAVKGILNDYPEVMDLQGDMDEGIKKAQSIRKGFSSKIPLDRTGRDGFDRNVRSFIDSKDNCNLSTEISVREVIAGIIENIELKAVIDENNTKQHNNTTKG